MHQKKISYVIVNFGGPRNLKEIRPFLETLLTDQDVIRTKLPQFLQKFIFKKIARNRAKKIQKDYIKIGGKSPIFFDTENIAYLVSQRLDAKVLTYHRYLTDTHQKFLEEINNINTDEIHIFPMFPQFSYATTGSIARFFNQNLSESILNKVRWIKSYPGHTSFIQAYTNKIQDLILEHQLNPNETILFFSSHGIQKNLVQTGDIYESECQISFNKIMHNFPYLLGKMGFQSKFGPGEWIQPYTEDMCYQVDEWSQGRKNIIIIPLSFTSDHIETLFEIEHLYLPILKSKKYNVFRCPALNQGSTWIDSIIEILKETNLMTNQMLIRRPLKEKA
jgi:protoporphyrin/coproporphyrin ferrochelatase